MIWASGSGVPEITWVTIKVALVSSCCAFLIGLPFAMVLALGNFRGRRTLQILANASMALPPVLVGVGVLIFILPQSALGGLRIEFTLTAVYVAQTLLALPYVLALVPAAVRGLPPGLLDQARSFGAGPLQLSLLALREARIGVLAAVIAAFASSVSEVAAVIIVGANIGGRDQTLASAIVSEIDYVNSIPGALSLGIVLLTLILVLIGALTVLQQRSGARLRWRGA
jgi:tungstate transport system permease protein